MGLSFSAQNAFRSHHSGLFLKATAWLFLKLRTSAGYTQKQLSGGAIFFDTRDYPHAHFIYSLISASASAILFGSVSEIVLFPSPDGATGPLKTAPEGAAGDRL